ncbi:MAG: DEAD/DEAH box helicase family protein [Sulfuriferula sp.]
MLNTNHLPANELRLRDCQEAAITKLETSFKAGRPRALIQMATGAGKTYTAITAIYRLLKHAHGKRILFLVDTKNLGEQAEQEMMSYVPLDDNRKFTELYNESPRVLRRLQILREWSHEQIEQIFPRSPRASNPHGARTSRRLSIPMGCH